MIYHFVVCALASSFMKPKYNGVCPCQESGDEGQEGTEQPRDKREETRTKQEPQVKECSSSLGEEDLD